MPRMSTDEKAAEIHMRGQVGKHYSADVYPVKGYTVVLPFDFGKPELCTCPATTECSHIKAAKLARRVEMEII
jgi:hypothetical protein